MPFPYTFPFPFQDKRDSKYSDGNYGATDKSPISAEYEGTVDKSPASSEYSDTVEKSPESDEYSSTQEKSPTSDEYGSMVNRSPTSRPSFETISATVQPPWQWRSTFASSPLLMLRDGFASSWLGQRACQPAPARFTPYSRSSTFSTVLMWTGPAQTRDLTLDSAVFTGT